MSRPVEHDGVVYRREGSKFWWICYRDRTGKRQRESSFTADWQQVHKMLRTRLEARDGNVLQVVRKGESLSFGEWADFFLENYSNPPVRQPGTHAANIRCVQHLKKAFATRRLIDVGPDEIELYLRERLRQRVRVRLGKGYREVGLLKATTVHQEMRVLRRMLNVAVRKRLLTSNPCAMVEFPVALKGMFRPHYVTWSEQQQIENNALPHLRNAIRIIAETGLRVKKELLPMKKNQIDFLNGVLWIPDSKTPNGVAEIPLTKLALEALQNQVAISGNGEFLFPSDRNQDGYLRNMRFAWRKALKAAKVPYFRIYDLRSTYATRLSAGGVADEWVIQMLRQGDSQVFKKYSQMKLQMKREALDKINRRANEMSGVLTHQGSGDRGFDTVLTQ
ncbi:MAG: tyrosine-type recombinase/integrase [Candidatus Acidiferrales bacterium]